MVMKISPVSRHLSRLYIAWRADDKVYQSACGCLDGTLTNYLLLCEIGINDPTSASSQLNGAGIFPSLSQLHLQCPSPHAHTYLSMFLQLAFFPRELCRQISPYVRLSEQGTAGSQLWARK